MAQTLAADIPEAHVKLMRQYFIWDFQDNIIFNPDSQLISYNEDIGGKEVDLVNYDKLAPTTSPLTDGTPVTPKQLSSQTRSLTPKEYGGAVRTTRLAELQTGGSVNTAASEAVGQQAAESINILGIETLNSTTNSMIANSVGSESSLTSSDTIQATDLNYVHNRLSRNRVPRINGKYIALANFDVIDDIKKMSDWQDVQKYADANQVLNHEVGTYKGFKWIGTQGNQANVDAGSTTVDTYDTIFMGAGGLGYGVSQPVRETFHIPDDPHERQADLGWYGVFNFKLVREKSVWVITSASSFGDNS